MIVTITAETETAIGNKSKAIVFKWNLSLEQLDRLNVVANELAEENE